MTIGDGAAIGSGAGPGVLRSVLWSYLGYLCEFITGVLLVAYVVRRVPVAEYGVFLLAQSLTGFLYILDFGLSNVLVQLYVSAYSSKGVAEVSRMASTLFVALLGVGSLGALLLSLLASTVPHLLSLPPATAATVPVLIVVVLSVPPTMAGMPLEHLCQAFHRFDRVNQVQIGMVLLRVGLTIAVLATNHGILGLAAVQTVVAIVRVVALWAAARGSIEGFEFNPLRLELDRVGVAMKVSGWAFGDDVARRVAMSSEPVILAGLSSLPQVAMFGIGGRLPAHIVSFATRGLSVLMPSLSLHYNEGNTHRLRQSYRNAYRLCVTGLLPVVVFAAICSRQLLEVWAGAAYRGAAPVLVWLLLSALSQVVEFPSDLVIYSHDRIRRAARFSIMESAAGIGLALALAAPYGAAGVAAGVAIAHWAVHLFGYLPEACHVAGVRPWGLWCEAWSGYGAAQAAVFAGGGAVLYLGSRHLSALAGFAACAAVCILYGAVWLAFTARPMWKAEGQRVSAAVI